MAPLAGRSVLSIPAENTLGFLRRVFACWQDSRLFAITRDPAVLKDLGLAVDSLPPGDGADDAASGGWGRFTHQPRLSDDPAQIVFSSGTEGRPKAILLSHRNLADVVARLNAVMGVTEEIREYIGVPVTYSFGLGRARAVAAAGGSFFLPERFDPIQIHDMLANGQINAISAVPSLWRQVLAAPGVIGAEGAKVRWIEIGSQYMAAADKLALRELFPNARIIQHYGLTEASRSTFLDISAAPEAVLESVGEAQGSVALRITDDGAVALRGDHVALGRILPGGEVQPLADAEGWFVTRDRGEIRDGRLWYLGRLDDQINLAGVKLGAEGLEEEIRRLVPAAASHFAIAPVPDPMRGEAVLLAIEDGAGDVAPLIEDAARLALRRRGVQVGQGSAGALKTLMLDRLPRTGTDKVQRRHLPGLWQSRQSEAAPDTALLTGLADGAGSPAVELTPEEARLAAIWARVVGQAQFTPDAGFYDLGGDSLSSVQIGLVMESEGLPRPVIRATMEGRSLREAAAFLAPAGDADGDADGAQPGASSGVLPEAALRSWSITMIRAVMALSVLLSHWGPGVFERLGIGRQAEYVLSLFYRMGTPGFAAVFGIGIGYFMLPDFARRRASVLSRLQRSFFLVLLGLTLLAAIHLANDALADRPAGNMQISGLDIAHAFYGVLAYYALMLGTARWWLPGLARLSRPIPWLMAGLPLLWILWQLVPALLPAHQVQSVLEWPRLMLVAGYNVFKMSAVAASGMAVGVWLAGQPDSRAAARMLLICGGLGMAVTVMSLIEMHGGAAFTQRGNPLFTSLPGLIFYLSFAAFGTGMFLRLLLSWDSLPSWTRAPLRLLLVIGGLALPIYVFHGLVMPGRYLLMAMGVPAGLDLAIPMGLFLLAMAYLGRRLWRMYFG